MELQILDPFGDYETAGYLRNTFQEKTLASSVILKRPPSNKRFSAP
jgi:hypothetical protein